MCVRVCVCDFVIRKTSVVKTGAASHRGLVMFFLSLFPCFLVPQAGFFFERTM